MKISLKQQKSFGPIQIPASKSMSQRVLAGALLHQGKTIVRNFGTSNDELAVLDILKNFGIQINSEQNILTIISDASLDSVQQINCGESGLAARLFVPIAALSSKTIRIEGNGSLTHRPMHFMQSIFEGLGAELHGFNGFIPFEIKGPITPQNISLDGSNGSQFLSGLLFAFSYSNTEAIVVEVKNLVSKPYIDLTIEVLAIFGKKITHENHQLFTIHPSQANNTEELTISIEGDWSSAAFWIAAATIKGSITLNGLNKFSKQADKVIIDVVKGIGAKVEWSGESLIVSHQKLNAFDVDLNNAPDLFPILAILAIGCMGQSKMVGIHRLVHKESNRIESITHLLTLLNIDYFISEDCLYIQGQSTFSAFQYYCPNDHRMAMAATLAAVYSSVEMEIINEDCVAKSYSEFWKHIGLIYH